MEIVIVVWIACGIISYGLTVAFFQRKYPELARSSAVGDRVFAVVMSLAGPVNLVVALLHNRCKYGWML